jgi:hypothetical protein
LKEEHVYDAKATDVYSVGVCLFQMLYYVKPFGENCTQRTLADFQKIQRNKSYKINNKFKVGISESAAMN